MHIGKRIKALRKRKKLYQSTLAQNIISESHLSNIEKGRYIPHQDILSHLAEKLDVPTEYLTNYSKIDPELRLELRRTLELIESNINLADLYLQNVLVNYKYIASMEQEIELYVLTIYLKFKKREVEEANRLCIELLSYVNSDDIDELTPSLQSLYLDVQAIYSFYQKNYIDSNYWYFKLLETSSLTSETKKANILHNIALNYWRMKDLGNAKAFCESALEVYYKQHLWKDIGDLYNFLAMIYAESHNFLKAIEQLERIFNLPDTDQDIIGKTHHNIGTAYLKAENNEKAFYHLTQALEIKRKGANKESLLQTIYVLTNLNLSQGKVNESSELINQVKSINIGLLNKYKMLSLEANLHFHKGDYIRYTELAKESLAFFEKEKMYEFVIILSKQLAEYYEENKKYKMSSIFYKKTVTAYEQIGGKYK